MKTASDFLDDVKAARGLRSDYQLAKFLGWKQQRITNYRRGGTFDDEAAAQIAATLDLEPAYIMACMAAQRAKTAGVRKTWEKAAKALAGTALGILAGSAIALAPMPDLIPNAQAASAPGLYIMLSVLLALGMALAALRNHG